MNRAGGCQLHACSICHLESRNRDMRLDLILVLERAVKSRVYLGLARQIRSLLRSIDGKQRLKWDGLCIKSRVREIVPAQSDLCPCLNLCIHSRCIQHGIRDMVREPHAQVQSADSLLLHHQLWNLKCGVNLRVVERPLSARNQREFPTRVDVACLKNS